MAYLVAYLGTVLKREEPHIYVANWFYLAFIITIAMLHIVNNLALPVSITGTKSYGAWSGVQDAMIQWWYGHNAVGFFLTAAFLGMMYYFIPKAANRPVYSYRLSIVHFWSLVFLYIWAGPHHLHYTSLPDWAQTLGMVFSVMLWMPSWGGMINGLMTLSGAWDKLRTDPGLRFSVTAVGFYGMATFEGPVMSIKAVNSLSHYTDWTIGHVHSGALGWVAFIVFGTLYYLVPKLWNRPAMWSTRLIGWHFWIATIGIVLYITAMWVSGIMQGLMWRAYDELGFLQYSFVETVAAMQPFYVIRLLGGLLLPHRRAADGLQPVAHDPRRGNARRPSPPCTRSLRRRAMFIRHEWIEKNVILMLVLTLITVSIGGLVQIVPLFTIETTIERVDGVRPYTPLELLGRNIYIREGCYTCHSQQIRPFKDEVERYGHYSLAAESMYDQPFQWGSKRTGPDLARVGGQLLQRLARGASRLAARRGAGERSCRPTRFLADKPLDYGDIAAAPQDAARGGHALHRRDDRQRQGRPRGSGRSRSRSDSPREALSACRRRQVQRRHDGASPRWMRWSSYLQMLGTLVHFGDLPPERLRQ